MTGYTTDTTKNRAVRELHFSTFHSSDCDQHEMDILHDLEEEGEEAVDETNMKAEDLQIEIVKEIG